LLIQLIVAALGGGLFFLIKSQWNVWFKRGKTKQNTKDDIEEIAPDEKKHSKPTTKEEKYAMIEVDSLKKPSKISTTAGKKKK